MFKSLFGEYGKKIEEIREHVSNNEFLKDVENEIDKDSFLEKHEKTTLKRYIKTKEDYADMKNNGISSGEAYEITTKELDFFRERFV